MQFTYRPVKTLGHGAFGEVVLSRVLETGELVALKKIFVRNAEQGIPDNIVREIKSMQILAHPNVVQLRDVRTEGHSIVLVMEYCVCDMARLLRCMSNAFPEQILKGMLHQMLCGLAACHGAGILHRDLKPSNLLLNHLGHVKLADFGLARPEAPPQPDGRTAKYTHTVATRWYRAPELLYGAQAYGQGVDIWALGIVFAEMLGLSPLLPGESDIDQLACTHRLLGSIERVWPEVVHLPDYGKICFPDTQPIPLSQLLPAAPGSALDMLGLMLKADPEQRPSAMQLLSHPYLLSEPLPSHPNEIAHYAEMVVMQSKAVNQRIANAKRGLTQGTA